MAPRNSDEVTRTKVLTDAIRRPELRSLAVIFTCFKVAEMGAWIAIITVAHERGGIDEASLLVVAQLAPAAIAAVFVGALARRLGLRRVLCGGLIGQSVALIGIAALLRADAPMPPIYALAVLGAVAVVTTRPTVAAIMPLVVDGPHELTAANSIVGWLDGAAVMAGPVITAVGFAVAGSSAPFVVFAFLTLLAAVLGSRISPGHRPDEQDGHNVAVVASIDDGRSRAAASDSPPAGSIRPILVVLASHAFLIGALDLLFVVVAIDVTNGPPARAGWLNAAFGLGALLGGTASVLLIGRPRLWPTVLGAGIGATATLALVGLSTQVAWSAVSFAACGLGAAVLLVSSRTLLQRCCDLESLCRAFSMAEASEMAMLLAGAMTIPLLVGLLGAQRAPIGVAALLLVALLVAVPGIVQLESGSQAPLERVEQLRSVELFATLPAPTLETLAREAAVVAVSPTTEVIVEGQPGDRYYVITAGEVAVTKEGAEVNRLGPGDGFGELALLYDVPRTATVVSTEATSLLAIDRAPFLVAMTEQPPEGASL